MTLIAWVVTKTIIDIYDSDKGMPAPGDRELGGDEGDKYNHLTLTLMSYSELLSRYRNDPTDINIRNILLPPILLPSIRGLTVHGKTAIPEEKYDDAASSIDREVIDQLGDAILLVPYGFQILKDWFLPSVITYNDVPLRFMIPLLSDILVEIWAHILAIEERNDKAVLCHDELFQMIIQNKGRIEKISFDDLLEHKVPSRAFVEIYAMVNIGRRLIASAAINFILDFSAKLGFTPFTQMIRCDIEKLQLMSSEVSSG